MLYDPKWEKTVKTNQFTVDALITWLETQDPATCYAFCWFSECLLGRWLRSMDPDACVAPEAISGYFYTVHGQIVDLTGFQSIAVGDGTHAFSSHTFGAALDRARATR